MLHLYISMYGPIHISVTIIGGVVPVRRIMLRGGDVIPRTCQPNQAVTHQDDSITQPTPVPMVAGTYLNISSSDYNQ